MKPQKLFAFWRYDLFPYVLGGEIRDFDEKGRVYVESYSARFTPIAIFPLEIGVEMLEKIKKIERDYNKALKEIKTEKLEEVFKVCPQLKSQLKG